MNDLNKEKTAQEVPVQEQPKITFEYLIDSPSKIFLTNDESLYKRLMENNQSIYMFGPEFNKSSNTENVLQIKIQDYHLVQILLDK